MKSVLLAVLLAGVGAATSSPGQSYGSAAHDALHADLNAAHSDLRQDLRYQSKDLHQELKQERKAFDREMKLQRNYGVPPWEIKAQRQAANRYFDKRHRAIHDY